VNGVYLAVVVGSLPLVDAAMVTCAFVGVRENCTLASDAGARAMHLMSPNQGRDDASLRQ
jgi:hypothetical protein